MENHPIFQFFAVCLLFPYKFWSSDGFDGKQSIVIHSLVRKLIAAQVPISMDFLASPEMTCLAYGKRGQKIPASEAMTRLCNKMQLIVQVLKDPDQYVDAYATKDGTERLSRTHLEAIFAVGQVVAKKLNGTYSVFAFDADGNKREFCISANSTAMLRALNSLKSSKSHIVNEVSVVIDFVDIDSGFVYAGGETYSVRSLRILKEAHESTGQCRTLVLDHSAPPVRFTGSALVELR